MVMEAQELVMRSKEIMKGKRTKRQRPMSPLRLTVTSSSSSGGGGGGSEQQQERNDNSSIEFAESTIGDGRGEEEDMANCLILLAQGSTRKILHKSSSPSKASPESYIYQCKTCNKCFSSFQALGGHRASHKKPNNNNNKISNYEEMMKKVIIENQEEDHVNNNMSTTLSLQIPNSNNNNVKSNNKFHECSICEAKFSSGQALGGHMRRHRAAFATTNGTSSCSPPEFQESKKPRNSIQLDLNLPAPEDDRRDSKFHFGSKEQVLVFSSSSLVDCHY